MNSMPGATNAGHPLLRAARCPLPAPGRAPRCERAPHRPISSDVAVYLQSCSFATALEGGDAARGLLPGCSATSGLSVISGTRCHPWTVLIPGSLAGPSTRLLSIVRLARAPPVSGTLRFAPLSLVAPLSRASCPGALLSPVALPIRPSLPLDNPLSPAALNAALAVIPSCLRFGARFGPVWSKGLDVDGFWPACGAPYRGLALRWHV